MKLRYGIESITKDMKENPEQYIPEGTYCHGNTRSDRCPFWDIDESMPEQENGYCHLLQQGDWQLNLEYSETTILEKSDIPADIKHIGKTAYEIFVSGEENIPYMPGFSLLWEQCKECGINDDEWEDE